MRMLLMFFDMIWSDMPATIMAGEGFRKARRTIERPAMEKLLQTMPVLGIEFPHRARQDCCLIPTFFAGLVIELLDQRSKVIVQSLGQHAGPGTEWTCHVQLIDNGLANKGAL